MSDETIPPALSAEEWARGAVGVGYDGMASPYIELSREGMRVCDDDYYVGFSAVMERPHAVMALANASLPDDHPGKITHLDLARVEGARDALLMDANALHGREPAFAAAKAELAADFGALAAKLASLLPPREEPT